MDWSDQEAADGFAGYSSSGDGVLEIAPKRRSWDHQQELSTQLPKPNVPELNRKLLERTCERIGSFLSRNTVAPGDIITFLLHIPGNARVREVFAIFDVHSVGENVAKGNRYVLKEAMKDPIPVESGELFFPIGDQARGRRNITDFFGQWIGEDRVTELNIVRIDLYRGTGDIVEKTEKAAEKALRSPGK